MCFGKGLKGENRDLSQPQAPHPVSLQPLSKDTSADTNANADTIPSQTSIPTPQSQARKRSLFRSHRSDSQPRTTTDHKRSGVDKYEDHLVAGFHSYGPRRKPNGDIITGDDDPDERRPPLGGLSPRELREVEHNYEGSFGTGGIFFAGAGFGMPGSK